MMLHACNLSTQNSEAVKGECGFKASLGYIESLKLICVI